MNFIDDFLELENKNELFTKKFNNVMFWDYIRAGVYKDIYIKKFGYTNGKSEQKSQSQLKVYFYILTSIIARVPSYVFKNPLIGLKKKDIVVLNSARRVKEGYFYEDIYTDEVLECINYTYYVFEKPFLGKHFKPVKTKNLKYIDYIDLLRQIRNKVKGVSVSKSISKQDIQVVNDIIDQAQQGFGVRLNKKDFFDKVKKLTIDYHLVKPLINKILKKVKPKIVIVISSGFYQKLFAEVAKENGIKVIEFQHGIISRYSIAYNYYKELNLKTFPDYVYLFGDYYKENVRFPIDEKRLKVTGFPYYESKLRESKNNHSCELPSAILFISQPTIGNQLSKIALKLSQIIDKRFSVIYKLHPLEFNCWEQKYPWLLTDTLKVASSNDGSIYKYFSASFCQVGVYSTAIFEGLGYNLKTIIVRLPGHKNMQPLYSKGYAYLVNTAEDIIGLLEEDSLSVIQTAINKNYFWCPDSINNINYQIDRLMHN